MDLNKSLIVMLLLLLLLLADSCVAWRIHNFSDSSEINVEKKPVSAAAKMIEDTSSVTKKHKCFSR